MNHSLIALTLNSLKAAILWAYDPAERDARLANEALRSYRKGIHELQVLVEIACAASPHHLLAVRKAYCSLFECSIEEDIVSTVSMPLRELLLGVVSAFRLDKEVVDNVVADLEADLLHDAIKAKQLNWSGVISNSALGISFSLEQPLHAISKSMEILLTRFSL